MKCVNSDGYLEAENPCIVKSDPMTLEQGGSNTAVTRELVYRWRRGESDCCNKVCFHNKTKNSVSVYCFCVAQQAKELWRFYSLFPLRRWGVAVQTREILAWQV